MQEMEKNENKRSKKRKERKSFLIFMAVLFFRVFFPEGRKMMADKEIGSNFAGKWIREV